MKTKKRSSTQDDISKDGASYDSDEEEDNELESESESESEEESEAVVSIAELFPAYIYTGLVSSKRGRKPAGDDVGDEAVEGDKADHDNRNQWPRARPQCV